MTRPIYLDHHATTPLDERVLEAMMPYLTGKYGNASSNHSFGWEAEAAVKLARRQVAEAIGAAGNEIIFTSGATEANNLAILGVARAYAAKGRHIVTSLTEHPCVLETCRYLERQGFRVTYLQPLPDGTILPEAVEAALTRETILVSLMAANNEIGTITDIAAIGALTRTRGILFHSDCAQAFGKIALSFSELPVDLASFSAHKCYGPKGAGALMIRRSRPRVRLEPLMFGGGHETGMRPGTLNVPAIVGMGGAMQLAIEEFDVRLRHLLTLRNDLLSQLRNALYVVGVNGPEPDRIEDWQAHSAAEISRQLRRLPDNLNVHFGSIDGTVLIQELREIAVSAGSACASVSGEPSHVLRAIGLDENLCKTSIRIGVGKDNTSEEINEAAKVLISTVRKLREGTTESVISSPEFCPKNGNHTETMSSS